MWRRSLIPVVMFVLGAVSVLAWQWTSRGPAPEEQPQTARTLAKLATIEQAPTQSVEDEQDSNATTDTSPAQQPEPVPAPAPTNISPAKIAKLSADATGTDPRLRAAAIVALGSAPKAEAAPVLEQVLSVADDADRPLALRSLRTLAQNQGDSDDRIRSVVRKVIYHDSNESFTQDAQATLDDIERDLNPATRAVKR